MEPFPISAPAFSCASRVVAAGNALEWLRPGWALFVVNPGVRIAMTILMLVVILGLHVVPLIGMLAANLLTPLLCAGLLQACRKLSNGETAEINDLFVGFKRNTGDLVMLGVLYLSLIHILKASATGNRVPARKVLLRPSMACRTVFFSSPAGRAW